MLLERLLSNIGVRLHPYGVCAVGGAERLAMPSQDWTSVHFVLAGRGRLAVRGHPPLALRAGLLVVVPPGLPHAFEGEPSHARTAPRTPPDGPELTVACGGLPHAFEGEPSHARTAPRTPPDGPELTVACGQARVLYASHSDVFAQLDGPLVLDYADDPDMTAIFEQLLTEQQSHLPGAEVMMSALMNRCVVRVFRDLCDCPRCDMPWLQALEDPELAPALEVMLKDPAAPHSLESLAATAHTSRSTFVRRFTARMGVAPMEYLRDIRLRRAAALLGESQTGIDTVARQVGFTSRSHFSRAFRERYGVPPSDWRRLDR